MRPFRFIAILLSVVAFASFSIASEPTSTITGELRTAAGEIISYGTLALTLSQPAIVAGTTTVVTRSSFCYTSAKGIVVGTPDPTAAPLLSVNTGAGLLPTGIYYVKIYYMTPNGLVSAVSPEAGINLTSSGTLNIEAPAYEPLGATGFGVAISTTSGAETIQGTVVGWKTYRQSQTLITGSRPALTNNSNCYIYSSSQLIPTGTYYSANLLDQDGSQVAGFPQRWCSYGGAGTRMDVSKLSLAEKCSSEYYPTPILWTSDGDSAQGANLFNALSIATAGLLNDQPQIGGKEHRCTSSEINSALKAASLSGKTLFIGQRCAGMTIESNLWGGITFPSKILFGPGTFIFNAQQILPSNTEVYCSGWETTLAISPSLNVAIAWGSGLFSNTANPALKGSGRNEGISIHDCVIEGTGNKHVTAGITLHNASNTKIFDLYLNNIYYSGIDIRNGSNNEVRDCWCVNCAAVGAPQHAIGGGVVASTDSFLYNKFIGNHVFGGGVRNGGADHFDIFGQAPQGHCGFNLFVGNTSDSAPIEGIFLDTCNHNVVSENVVRSARRFAIACTSGVHNQEGGCSHNVFVGNKIHSSSQAGHYFNNNANQNIITGEEVWNPGSEAVLINDSGGNRIENVSIHLSSQSSASAHCGVTINSDKTGAYASDNIVRNSTIFDSNPQALKDICLNSVGGSTYVAKNIVRGKKIKGVSSVEAAKTSVRFDSHEMERPYKFVLSAGTLQSQVGIYVEVKAVRGCATGDKPGKNCATPITITWPEPFVDTNYSGGCVPRDSPSNHPGVPYIVSKTVSSMAVNYIATSPLSARWALLDCWAIHD